jgi:AraC-like DNA-binding protein
MQQPFCYEFVLNDLLEYKHQLSDALKMPIQGDELSYPDEIAAGGSKFFRINDYIAYQVVDYISNTSMQFVRHPSQENHVTITFHDFSFVPCKYHKDCDEIMLTNNNIGSIQCKSTRIKESIVVDPGLQVKVLIIMLKENWVENILHDQTSKEKFYRYLVNTNANLRKEFFSVEQRNIFNEIFTKRPFMALEQIFYESRVLHLLESFLTDVLMKEDEETPNNFLFGNQEDIAMMQKAEQYISENITSQFPGVDYLSKICCMSRTKFINLFQKVYNCSSFDYYQKKRLARAHEYIKSGKHSIADIAEIIGYSGVNNFAVAFKKEFGYLPKELMEQMRAN